MQMKMQNREQTKKQKANEDSKMEKWIRMKIDDKTEKYGASLWRYNWGEIEKCKM